MSDLLDAPDRTHNPIDLFSCIHISTMGKSHAAMDLAVGTGIGVAVFGLSSATWPVPTVAVCWAAILPDIVIMRGDQLLCHLHGQIGWRVTGHDLIVRWGLGAMDGYLGSPRRQSSPRRLGAWDCARRAEFECMNRWFFGDRNFSGDSKFVSEMKSVPAHSDLQCGDLFSCRDLPQWKEVESGRALWRKR